MARLCKVCTHKERKDIDKMIVAGVKYRNITQQFSITKYSLSRHKKFHISHELIKSKQAEEIADAETLVDELKRYKIRIQKLYDACDAWLRDPKNIDEYYLGPRAEEVWVIYEVENKQGKRIRKKATLHELVNKITKTINVIEYKHADPRDLILKTATVLNKQLELLAQITGELTEQISVKIEMSEEWKKLRGAMLQLIDPYPDIKSQMIQLFEAASVNANN